MQIITPPSLNAGFARRKGESAYPQLWDGLVACYEPGLGPQGGVLYDFAGRRLDGTLTNMDPATDWVVTERGYALDFDGSNDYVEAATLNSSAVAIYFRARFIGTPALKAALCYRSPDGNTTLTVFWWNSGNGMLCQRGATSASSNATQLSADPDITQWHDYVAQWDGVTARPSLFVDGIDRSANASSGLGGLTGTGLVRVANRNADFFASMQLSRLYVASRLWTPGEIQNLYLGASPLTLRKRRKLYSIQDASPQTLTPDPAVVTWTVPSAAIVPGSVTLSPSSAVVTWTANDLAIVPGSVTLSPAAAVVTWTANTPTIVPGSVTLTTDAAVVNWTANDPTISANVTLPVSAAVVNWIALSPTIIPGSVTLQPNPAVVQWTANDFTIPGGVQILTPDAAVVTWVANGVTLTLQSCPILAGCTDNYFTYQIEGYVPTPMPADCPVFSGCLDQLFTYSVE